MLVEKQYPPIEIPDLLTLVNNWTSIPPEVLPKEIEILQPVRFEMKRNQQVVGISQTKAGALVRPAEISGEEVVITSLAVPEMEARIAINQTNLKEKVKERHDLITNQIRKTFGETSSRRS